MREVEFCMRYADNCKRCPKNRICEAEYNREMEQKSGGVSGKRPSNLQILWDSPKGASMQAQKKPGKTRGQAKRKVSQHKGVAIKTRRD